MSAPAPDTASFTALWRLVWDTAKTNPATLLALISALTALMSTGAGLVTAIVTPLISFHIMRRQVRATTVSTNRQAWINALRDDLSELFELMTRVFSTAPESQSEERTDKVSRVMLLSYRIGLRLNPLEQYTKELIDLIGRLRELSDGSDPNAEQIIEFEETINSAVLTSQRILKTEWERVKKGN